MDRDHFTRFVLAGGDIWKAPDGGRQFCREVLKGLRDQPIVLECLFGLSSKRWTAAAERDRELFIGFAEGINFDIQIGEQKRFVEQLANVDAIYFRGGSPTLMLDNLRKVSGLADKLKGKTVVGSSAGAYAVSEYYLDVSRRPRLQLARGLGLLPIKVVAHYRSDFFERSGAHRDAPPISWDQVDELMEKSHPALEYVALREGEFRVYETRWNEGIVCDRK